MTPSHLEALLVQGREEEAVPGRCLVLGGEPLSGELVERVRGLRPECLISNHYGPSECTVGALSEEVREERGEWGSGVIALGRPLGNMRVYILDGEGEAVPVGVAGELYIGGVGVGRGYLNRAELTAERFIPDPFVASGGERRGGERLYKTGDLGRWLRNGEVEFLGRNDFQVKVRGFRIELGEIEARLREREGVKEAVVVPREDTAGDKRLVAYYTCREGNEGGTARVGAEELREHVAENLPEYMVPVAYVRLAKLPLTANGKLDRKALPEPEGEQGRAKQYEEPVGETENVVAGVWTELLKVERVGRHDNFFELGGHSLLAVRAIARLRRTLKVELTIVDLFAHPALASLAERVINLQLEQFDSDKLNDVLSLMRAAPAS
jgi:acyl-coenzyme A synthetase/AMP-(fatty) acid ligase